MMTLTISSDMRHQNFDGEFFDRANFSGINLTGSNLSECVFIACDFRNTILREACCDGSLFIACHFQGADIQGWSAEGARFLGGAPALHKKIDDSQATRGCLSSTTSG